MWVGDASNWLPTGAIRAESDAPYSRASGLAVGAFRAAFAQLRREIETIVSEGFPRIGDDAWRGAPPLRHPGSEAARPAADVAPARPATSPRAFLDDILPFAREAAAALGVSVDLVAGHAALESGWGRHPVTMRDGADSHNLFGLKAGAGWAGSVVDVPTTEFVDGTPLKTVERFRAYPDYRAAFADYVAMLKGNPRFRDVVGAGRDAAVFAAALARGGYATDPAYASKLRRVVADVAALRAGRDGGLTGTRRTSADRSAARLPRR
ncbi:MULTISPECIES: glycoside hydrolase family 73 protein [unclassified Burkholderia]|uniref:glycoside hydrolase family 73 protein n=1 Tax=unclassified Burkholderia TaxID=2613784 RepID=UPI0007566B4C|nr:MULTISPECIES: glucosaminidase domain-containing protein [unclassified Burkholderia]KUY54605.1 hypothetical protein WS45_19435 [Burkholderia sp. RF2-non_BP3]KUY72490.1 hypothetical protein WS46_28275 [Burkholderia sp. RF4-BP95]